MWYCCDLSCMTSSKVEAEDNSYNLRLQLNGNAVWVWHTFIVPLAYRRDRACVRLFNHTIYTPYIISHRLLFINILLFHIFRHFTWMCLVVCYLYRYHSQVKHSIQYMCSSNVCKRPSQGPYKCYLNDQVVFTYELNCTKLNQSS